jgi:hypothetical protein
LTDGALLLARAHGDILVFLRQICGSCTISRHLIVKAGLTRTTGVTGAVTLVQGFGSALNLNVRR